MDALDRAIKWFGTPPRDAHLADALEVGTMAVSQWRRRGVPAERVLPIVRAVQGAIKPFELRPDIYPDPNWLPPGLVSSDPAAGMDAGAGDAELARPMGAGPADGKAAA